jgi:hypothetical protein
MSPAEEYANWWEQKEKERNEWAMVCLRDMALWDNRVYDVKHNRAMPQVCEEQQG